MDEHLVALASMVVAAVVASGCSEKSAEKCSHALSMSRQALELRDMNSATQWRDYATKYCEDASLVAALDAEISTKKDEVATPSPAPAPAAVGAKLDPTGFIKWIADRGGKLPAVENEDCYGPDDPESGWCSAAAKESGGDEQHISVRWLKADPTAIQFSTSSVFEGDTEVRCESIGASKIRRWQWNRSLKGNPLLFSHCKMPQGPLAQSGWHILIKKVDQGSWILVSSDGFLQRHKNTLHDWETAGTTM
jgi:hypothetical protein